MPHNPNSELRISKQSTIFYGLLFFTILGLIIALLFAPREFLLEWWWAISLVLLILLILTFWPKLRQKLKLTIIQKRVGLIVFIVIPLLVLLLYCVFILPQKYDIIAVRIIFLLLVCLFPATLYYLFVSTRRYSLLNDFITNLTRLGLLTKRESENNIEYERGVLRYLQKFEAIYGALPIEWIKSFLTKPKLFFAERKKKKQDSQGFVSIFATQTTIPVVLATIFITIGWMITVPVLLQKTESGWTSLLVPEEKPMKSTKQKGKVMEEHLKTLFDSTDQVGKSVDEPKEILEQSTDNREQAVVKPSATSSRSTYQEWMRVLEPIETPISFAFLGAYFFSFQMLFRRYVRRDLGASAYVAILLRITLAVIGTWITIVALKILPGVNPTDEQLVVIGFVIGVFPRVALQIVLAAGRSVFNFVVPSLKTKLPISDLDGLTVWHEVRLEEEDIENIPNMATTDIVELMINTRFPPNRIIDWVDQAILYTQLEPTKGKKNTTSDRAKLHTCGIRNASSLVEAYKISKLHKEKELFEKLLADEEQSRVNTLVGSIMTNPNLELIMKWRNLKND